MRKNIFSNVINWVLSRLDFDVDFAVVEGEADEPVDAYERQGVDEGRQRLVAGEWHEQVVVDPALDAVDAIGGCSIGEAFEAEEYGKHPCHRIEEEGVDAEHLEKAAPAFFPFYVDYPYQQPQRGCRQAACGEHEGR